MSEWREQWLPQSMAGGRPNKEASDVTLEHALAMELPVMQNRSVGAMALDWAKFFDSINRDIGDALMKRLMTQDSSVEAHNYVSAESRFGRQARYRFKIGKATTAMSKTRGGGYFQGPSYSIQVALACMSVWTRHLESDTRCKTCGFIDDSSLRADPSLEEDEALTQLQEAWDKSKAFGNLAGAKLNETKVKMMASTTTMERKMNAQFAGAGLKMCGRIHPRRRCFDKRKERNPDAKLLAWRVHVMKSIAEWYQEFSSLRTISRRRAECWPST